jgi:PKD repeat protein
MRTICLSIAIIMVMGSCSKNQVLRSTVMEGPKPTAAFTFTAALVNAQQLTFSNTSQNAETVYWQFGDGTSSTEASPVHIYAAAARYTIILTTRSAAGYSATDSVTTMVAAPAMAGYTTAVFNLQVAFTNTSTAVDSVSWDFGDNSGPSSLLSPVHSFSAPGDYTVTLTVHGLAGNTATSSNTVTVANNNLLRGGAFEVGDGQYWSQWSSQSNNPPQYGYTGAHPAGGLGGSLRFPGFSNSAGFNELIYQPVQVTAGKQYQLSVLAKVPAGKQDYLQLYITTDANTWNEPAQTFLSLNAWHGWGTTTLTVAVDGDMAQLVPQYGSYGFGGTTGGVYSAVATGTIYIGIQAGCYAGASNGDFILDNMSFREL